MGKAARIETRLSAAGPASAAGFERRIGPCPASCVWRSRERCRPAARTRKRTNSGISRRRFRMLAAYGELYARWEQPRCITVGRRVDSVEDARQERSTAPPLEKEFRWWRPA